MYMMNAGLVNHITLVFASNWWGKPAARSACTASTWIIRLTPDNITQYTSTPFTDFLSMTYLYGGDNMNRSVLVAFSVGDAAAKVRTIRSLACVSFSSAQCKFMGHCILPAYLSYGP